MTKTAVGSIALPLLVLLVSSPACSSSTDTIDTSVVTASVAESSAAEPSESESSESEGFKEADRVEELFPDVVAVDAQRAEDGTWTFAVTLSSPYDTPERYADAWRVRSADGTSGPVYGVRELTHDHQNEQPFTRSQTGIEIPDDVDTVVVEGRDQVSGWGGDAIEFQLP